MSGGGFEFFKEGEEKFIRDMVMEMYIRTRELGEGKIEMVVLALKCILVFCCFLWGEKAMEVEDYKILYDYLSRWDKEVKEIRLEGVVIGILSELIGFLDVVRMISMEQNEGGGC